MAHLLTREDARFFRIHALCGLYALLHFLYRLVMWLKHRSFLFSGTFATPLSLWRLQTIAFSFRSIAVLLLMWWSLRTGAKWPLFLRGLVCLATSAAVDAAGAHYSQQSPPPGANGDAHPGAQPRKMSLMREMPWPKDTPESVRKAATFFYSASQLFATGALMLGDRMVGPFFVLGVIQISGFLSTLVRKGLITSGSWHRLYGSLLGIGYPLLIVPAVESLLLLRRGTAGGAGGGGGGLGSIVGACSSALTQNGSTPAGAAGGCGVALLAPGTITFASSGGNGSAGVADIGSGACDLLGASAPLASSSGISTSPALQGQGRLPEAVFIVPVALLVIVGRLRFGMSKYLLWGAATAAQCAVMHTYGVMDTVVF